jgi:ABC-2 type transport system ATP-binding protein
MEAVVEFVDVSKSYGHIEALNGVSLRVERGEVVALLGPNGAGKTTAVSLMLGLRRPSRGDVRLFGLPPHDLRARSRAGVMLQESGVPAQLTVRETIDLFRTYYPRPLPGAEVLSLAILTEKAAARVGTLSGGEHQRLYYALAICGDPEALFLDEPSVGMDVETRRAFWASVRRLAHAGKTILLTTHYLQEADELAQRVVVIDRGEVVADAAPAVIKSRVASKRVTFETQDGFHADALGGADVQTVEVNGRRVRLLTSEPERALRALFASGVEVTNLEVVGADLEEAFLALTQRKRDG